MECPKFLLDNGSFQTQEEIKPETIFETSISTITLYVQYYFDEGNQSNIVIWEYETAGWLAQRNSIRDTKNRTDHQKTDLKSAAHNKVKINLCKNANADTAICNLRENQFSIQQNHFDIYHTRKQSVRTQGGNGRY